ncbi:MAG: fibrobacter succinogenes major paralogous domain-containing protein, partial [Bacteroidales bacterium]|nr:fibrobacter succinogenes major paralogous domain-containing protein [Bacteroidales bacterium]
RQNGKTASIKMVNNGGGNGNRIEYTGIVGANNYSPKQTKSDTRGVTDNPFAFGDMMEYVGYATINGGEDTVIVSQQQTDALEIVVPFETAQTDGLPCPGTPTLTDIDGNVYNTVMIGNQCWMKENLRTTKFPDNTSIPVGSDDNNSDTDPYLYAPYGEVSNVATYGYLYNWPAVMHNAASSGANPSGVQGICPTGWHVPSDADWTQLTNCVGSQPQYQCGNSSYNYYAKALASTTGWNGSTNTCALGNNPSANNATGFSALPAGNYYDGNYTVFGNYTYFWSATEDNIDNGVYYRYLYYHNAFVGRYYGGKDNGFSVRCLRD